MPTKPNKSKARALFLKLASKDEVTSLLALETQQIQKSLKSELGKVAAAIETIKKEGVSFAEEIVRHRESFKEDLKTITGAIVSTREDQKKHAKAFKESYDKLEALYESVTGELESTKGMTSSDLKKVREEILKNSKSLMTEIERVRDLRPKAWGGSSRMIYNNGATMSPQNLYSDINLIMGAGLTITTVNNTTTDRVDVTISVTGGGGGNFVDNEVVSGVNNIWRLINLPVTGSVHLYANGQRLTPGGVDYTINTTSVTTVNPWASGSVLADYRK